MFFWVFGRRFLRALSGARAALLLAHSAEKLGVVDKARLLCAELRKAAAGTVAVPVRQPGMGGGWAVGAGGGCFLEGKTAVQAWGWRFGVL